MTRHFLGSVFTMPGRKYKVLIITHPDMVTE
jgi:hypothetical protein